MNTSPAPDRTDEAPRPIGWGIALIAGGGLWLAAVVGVDLDWQLVLAVALVVVGMIVLVGGRAGVAEAFIGVGIVLVILAVVGPVGTGVTAALGDVVERPGSVADVDDDYTLGAGQFTLDLRDVSFSERVAVSVRVGAGEIVVLLPADVAVTGDARAGVGELDVFGRERSGIGPGMDISASPEGATASVDLRLRVGAGSIEVRQ